MSEMEKQPIEELTKRQASGINSTDTLLVVDNRAGQASEGAYQVEVNEFKEYVAGDAKRFLPPTHGTAGQLLRSTGDGGSEWGDAASPEEIAEAVTDWLDENVPTGETLVVDESLTIEGAAAEAKVTGEKITAVEEDIEDLRKEMFSAPIDYTEITTSASWTTGSGVDVQTGGNISDSDYCRTGFIAIKSTTYIHLDSETYDFNVWEYTSNNVGSAIFAPKGAYNDKDVFVTFDQNATYFRIGARRKDLAHIQASDIAALTSAIKTYVITDPTLTISGAAADAKAVGDNITGLRDKLNDVTELVADVDTHQETAIEIITPTWTQGYTNQNGSVGSSTTLYYCTPINVSEGDVIQPTRGDNGLIASVYYLTAYYGNSAVSSLGGNNVSMPYTVPSGVDQIVLTIASVYLNYGTPKIKRTYTHNVETFDPKFVDKNGVAQVKTQNIDGMTELVTGVSENLFSKATLVASGKYVGLVSGTTGKAVLYDNALYDTYIVPVDGESTYTFTNVRFGCVVTDLEFTAVGSLLTEATEIDSTGGNYVLFSFAPSSYPTATYIITKPTTYYKLPSNWIFDTPKSQKETVRDTIASDGTLEIVGRSALKDGEVITFKGFFEAFNGFSLNFYGTGVTNYITVTASSITIKNTTITPTAINHGLTIENYVSLECQFTNGKMKITLYSSSGSYTTTVDWHQINADVTQPQIVSNGTTFSNAVLSVSYDAVKRNVWYFGDSYVSVTDPARWTYYLTEDGFLKNILLNGASGGASGGAIISFGTLLKYGTPKIAVFGTGMNDGSDGSAPSAAYVSRRTEFINLCKANSIEPVFCTVPTVPTINNEKKNEWVRASGYRYIDFASAVGADGSGDWFPGMLSTDNVHPTATGAKALYAQVLVDLPEVTIS